MTGFLDSGMPNPMSILSLASYKDLGYEIDESMAEEYFLPSEFQRPFNAEKIEIFGDALVFDLADYREHEIGPAQEDLTGAVGGIIGLMIIGMFGLGALMWANNNKQIKLLQRIAASQPSEQSIIPQRQGTKNAMFNQ